MHEEWQALTRRHLKIGWYSLALFVLLGTSLEMLHGFKVSYYLDVGNEARRLMWRLSHAHGTLLGLLNLAFVVTLPHLDPHRRRLVELASASLAVATLTLPLGFFLGGATSTGGDPGPLVLLVPPAALLLLGAVLLTARSLRSRE